MDYTIIPLTHGATALVSPEDADLAQYKWHLSPANYAIRNIPTRVGKQRLIQMHRIIIERMIGRVLVRGELPDHKNGKRLDNRRDNLRVETDQQNAINRSIRYNNKSGFKGVSWNSRERKWVAQIQVHGKGKHLGYFTTPEEASAAYEAAAAEHFGEWRRV